MDKPSESLNDTRKKIFDCKASCPGEDFSNAWRCLIELVEGQNSEADLTEFSRMKPWRAKAVLLARAYLAKNL